MTGARLPAAGAPAVRSGLIDRVRRDYFSTPANGVVSMVGLALVALATVALARWLVLDAVWRGDGPEACRGAAGACWLVIEDRYRLILFGLYPYEEQWRSTLACLAIIATVVLSCLPALWSVRRLPFVWVAGYATFYFLMRGGVFGWPIVLESQWGGLALTLFVFSSVVLAGMPLAIGLSLLRRSRLPVIANVTALFIDAVRSLPLVAILFTAAIVLPYALPAILQGDKLYRVITGFAVFFAVYQAEILRGGMQAISTGQEEAATALGLNRWQTVTRITLPQAFHYALPPTINQIVITFMETSLIIIIGFFEVMASGNAAFSTAEWTSYYAEVYVFVALIYLSFTLTLSRYGQYWERRLSVSSVR